MQISNHMQNLLVLADSLAHADYESILEFQYIFWGIRETRSEFIWLLVSVVSRSCGTEEQSKCGLLYY